MKYSEAMKDIGAIDRTAAFSHVRSRTGSETDNAQPLKFGNVFRERASEELTNAAETDSVPQRPHSSFFAGATIEMLGAKAQIKDVLFDSEFGNTDEQEELDSDISFDEIAELDEMTDTAAAESAKKEAGADLFFESSLFSDDPVSDDDLLEYSELSELGDVI